VGREFHDHLVARQDADVVHPHLPTDVGEHVVAVLQLDTELRVREGLRDGALYLDGLFFLCHTVSGSVSWWCPPHLAVGRCRRRTRRQQAAGVGGGEVRAAPLELARCRHGTTPCTSRACPQGTRERSTSATA